MYTLDANIFLRDLEPHNPEYPVCHALIERLQTASLPIVVPLLLFAEIAGALSRELHDPIRGRMAVMVLRSLPNLTGVALDAILAYEAADLAADCALRGADAVYVAVARQCGGTLVTLDREVRERAARVVPTCTPAELLAILEQPPAP